MSIPVFVNNFALMDSLSLFILFVFNSSHCLPTVEGEYLLEVFCYQIGQLVEVIPGGDGRVEDVW